MFQSKIGLVVLGITKAEGWRAALSASDLSDGSNSWRHHNPGNIQASPFEVSNIGGKSVFSSDIEGLAAVFHLLREYCLGQIPETSSSMFLQAALEKYTGLNPASAEFTDYLKIVCDESGLTPETPISQLFH